MTKKHSDRITSVQYNFSDLQGTRNQSSFLSSNVFSDCKIKAFQDVWRTLKLFERDGIINEKLNLKVSKNKMHQISLRTKTSLTDRQLNIQFIYEAKSAVIYVFHSSNPRWRDVVLCGQGHALLVTSKKPKIIISREFGICLIYSEK